MRSTSTTIRERIKAQGSMKRLLAFWCFTVLIGLCQSALAQVPQKVVDVPTRPGVTQRFLYLAPESPIAAVILFAGGHGGLQILPNGSFKWGAENFLVRTRQLFAKNGLSVAVVDAPSDRQATPFLDGFRQRPEHVADIKAVIAWIKQQTNVPVWLVGTSRRNPVGCLYCYTNSCRRWRARWAGTNFHNSVRRWASRARDAFAKCCYPRFGRPPRERWLQPLSL